MDESFWRRMFGRRWSSGTQNTIRRCSPRNKSSNTDVENDGNKIDVIIIDSPECSERSRRSSSSSLKCNKKCFPRRFIIIDEENDDYHFSSTESYLSVDSDSESDSDYGCEIMDDPIGDIRKEWEKAYLTRRKGGDHIRVKSEDVTSSSSNPNGNVDENLDVMEEGAHDVMPNDDVNDKGEQSCNGMMDSLVENVQNDVIAELGKYKETEEYKLAQEKEWAARQEQIKIQQEEAQRLRKRKKAQTMRLLDMERRQKQRLEEIRESQKRDEETIDLKDNLRAMIRKDLEFLELKHRDTVSLLRALGINVGRSGYYPLSSEVNAALKQALFRFHPDRASKTDIREQVEAEEKFKLISRLKQKLVPVA